MPPDSVRCTTGHVRCTRGLQLKLVTFGKFQRRLRYNSSDCPVYTGQCSVLQGRAASGTRQPREFTSAAPLKFTGLSGVTAGQRLFRRQRLPATHLMRARSAQSSGTREQAHRTIYSSCPVCTGHPGGPRSQNSNGQIATALVTWLSHRTCSVCTGLSGAPSNRQPPNDHFWWLGL